MIITGLIIHTCEFQNMRNSFVLFHLLHMCGKLINLNCALKLKIRIFMSLPLSILLSYLLTNDWFLFQGFASLPAGICVSSMNRPVSYDQAIAWKVLNDDDSNHCLAFMFVNWSFV